VDPPNPMTEQTRALPRITIRVNIFITLALFAIGFFEEITNPRNEGPKSILRSRFHDRPGIALTLLTLVYAVWWILASLVFQQYWNRFLSEHFSWRVITFGEAYAFVIVFAIFLY
jgi:hypothetical protein